MEHEPKISTPEAFLWVTLSLVADILSIIPVVNWVVLILYCGSVFLYTHVKGVKNQKALFGMIIEAVPALSVLPAYTVTMGITIYLDRHPEQAQKLAITQKLNIKKPKGSIPAPQSRIMNNEL